MKKQRTMPLVVLLLLGLVSMTSMYFIFYAGETERKLEEKESSNINTIISDSEEKINNISSNVNITDNDANRDVSSDVETIKEETTSEKNSTKEEKTTKNTLETQKSNSSNSSNVQSNSGTKSNSTVKESSNQNTSEKEVNNNTIQEEIKEDTSKEENASSSSQNNAKEEQQTENKEENNEITIEFDVPAVSDLKDDPTYKNLMKEIFATFKECDAKGDEVRISDMDNILTSTCEAVYYKGAEIGWKLRINYVDGTSKYYKK